MIDADAETVAAALHELRGPIGAVRLGVELALRNGSLPESGLRGLALELGRALQALDDLDACLSGDRSRRKDFVSAGAGGGGGTSAAGREDPDGSRVELCALVADSVEAWRPVAQGRRLVLAASDGALWVLGDRLRLAQAIGNLLSNAIRHGDGTVAVRLRRFGAGRVRIEVGDGGAGLAASLPELMSTGRHGLRVVAGVAAAHHGRLLSAPSETGARLVLELPLASEVPARAVDGAR